MCESFRMSTQPESAPGIPEWDTADRMRKALRSSGIGVEEMADYLDVTRRSVGNWINGHIQPSKQTLRLWAMRCGVDFNWLCHGDATPCGPRGGKHVSAGQQGGNMDQSANATVLSFQRINLPKLARTIAA